MCLNTQQPSPSPTHQPITGTKHISNGTLSNLDLIDIFKSLKTRKRLPQVTKDEFEEF